LGVFPEDFDKKIAQFLTPQRSFVKDINQ
jgi:hypothetical protein